jgi:hypothetical protein
MTRAKEKYDGQPVAVPPAMSCPCPKEFSSFLCERRTTVVAVKIVLI